MLCNERLKIYRKFWNKVFVVLRDLGVSARRPAALLIDVLLVEVQDTISILEHLLFKVAQQWETTLAGNLSLAFNFLNVAHLL